MSEPASAPDPAPPRLRRGYLALLALGVAAAVVGAGVTTFATVNAPPPAMAREWLPGGVEVRLLAVTRGHDHRFAYAPPKTPGRRLCQALGLRAGDAPVSAAADVPRGAVTLWLRIAQPRAAFASGLLATDEERRTYRDQAVRTGARPWGQATLGWVALTNFDRTARRLEFGVPIGAADRLVTFAVDGPGEAPARWKTGSAYPLRVGDRTAEVRLWQLRPVDPLSAASLATLTGGQAVSEPSLVADFDVLDRGSSGQPGQWLIEVAEATTDHGERLEVVTQQAGLVWLTHHRVPDFGLVSFNVTARKWVRDRATVLFRGLELPGQVGQRQVWRRQADEPFPSGTFILREGERTKEDRLALTIEAHAPPGTQIPALSFAAGLDQGGRPVRPAADRTATLLERRESQVGVSWKWSCEVAVAPSSTALALAFGFPYRRVSAACEATFLARVQPAEPEAGRAALGLLVEPAAAREGQPTRWRVTAVIAGSRAARSPLRVGDEVVAVDGLPPVMVPRVLLRHAPQETVPVVYRREGRLLTAAVGLDPHAS